MEGNFNYGNEHKIEEVKQPTWLATDKLFVNRGN